MTRPRRYGPSPGNLLPYPRIEDVGQWLCVPPFRVVCRYQASRVAMPQRNWSASCYLTGMKDLGGYIRERFVIFLNGISLPSMYNFVSAKDDSTKNKGVIPTIFFVRREPII
jgi:hypothetical protein